MNFISRIVLINTGPIKTTDFNLTQAKKDFLLVAGKLAAVKFIRKYYPDADTSMYDVTILEEDSNDKLKKL